MTTHEFLLIKKIAIPKETVEVNVKDLFACSLLILIVAAAMGCGGAATIPVVEVDAKITVGGEPPKGSASILVQPEDASLPNLSGYLDADGTAVFWTNGSQEEPDGLPVGKHTLTLSMDPMSPGAMVSAKPTEINVEAPGTLTIDMEPGPPGGGGFMDLGGGTPGRP